LVVIAVIAILAAILFPAFARARENARRASCQSNVKQILLGVAQYSQDYNERMVHAYIKFAPQCFNTWGQFLQPYLKSTQIFTCPRDSKTGLCSWQVTPAPQGVVNPFHSSYVGNIMAMGSYEFGTSVSLASLVSPSTTVFMADGGSTVDLSKPITVWENASRQSDWLLIDPANEPKDAPIVSLRPPQLTPVLT